MPPEKLMTNENVKDLYKWMGDVNATLGNLDASQTKSEEQLSKRIDDNKSEFIKTSEDVVKLRVDYTAFKTATEVSVREKARFWGIVTIFISAMLGLANLIVPMLVK